MTWFDLLLDKIVMLESYKNIFKIFLSSFLRGLYIGHPIHEWKKQLCRNTCRWFTVILVGAPRGKEIRGPKPHLSGALGASRLPMAMGGHPLQQ
jgi:hypothetical protein